MSKVKVRALWSILFIAAVLLSGCSQSGNSPDSPQPAVSPIAIHIDPPTPLRQLKNTTFGIHLALRSTRKPVKGASVAVTLTMPSMLMPPTVVPCREVSPGYYRGDGTFTMPGDWRLDVAAGLPNGTKAKLSRSVHVE